MSLIDFDPDLSGELHAVIGVAFGWDDRDHLDEFEEHVQAAGLVGIGALGAYGPSEGYGVLALPPALGGASVLVQVGEGGVYTLSATEQGRLPWLFHSAFLSVEAMRWTSAPTCWPRILPDLELLAEALGGDSDLPGLGSMLQDPEVRWLLDSGQGLRDPLLLLQRLDPSAEFGALASWFSNLEAEGSDFVPGAALGPFRAAAALIGFSAAKARGDEHAASEAAWLALSTRAGRDHETCWHALMRCYGWSARRPEASMADRTSGGAGLGAPQSPHGLGTRRIRLRRIEPPRSGSEDPRSRPRAGARALLLGRLVPRPPGRPAQGHR